MGSNSFYGKNTSIHFTVKNIAGSKKKVTVFNINIGFNQERDLLSHPEVSEAMIRESLVKGELANKIRVRELVITSSTIDLTQFDPQQKQFLLDAGCNLGVDPARAAKDAGVPFIELAPLDDEPPANSFFFDVDGVPSYTDSDGYVHAISSGGGGSGPYDHLTLTNPQDGSILSNNTIFRNTAGGVSYKDVVGDISPMDITAPNVLAALNNAENTVFINKQRLTGVAHPDNSVYNATTVGWIHANYLPAVGLQLLTDDITLSGNRWQAYVQNNPDTWFHVLLPDGGNIEGDIVLVHSISGSSCVTVSVDGGFEMLVPDGQTYKFTFTDSSWTYDGLSDAEWAQEIFKHAAEVSGGPFTIIPSGGTLQGTYKGTVVCQDCTMTGAVSIHGDLLASGTLTNEGGFDLQVNGDLIAENLMFNPPETPPLTYQGNILVSGDLVAQNLHMRKHVPRGQYDPSIIIRGDMSIFQLIDGRGYAGAPGLNITTDGDAVCNSITIQGGDADSSVPDIGGGDGGNLFVHGNLFTSEVIAHGGENHINLNLTSGDGGNLQVLGNILGGVYQLYGADCGNDNESFDNAGDGGVFICEGFAKVDSILTIGGNCNSTSSAARAGLGGNIQIGGDLWVGEEGAINSTGGNRSGTLTEAGQTSSPNGGTISIGGSLYASEGTLQSKGGDIVTQSFKASNDGGTAGNIIIEGDAHYAMIDLRGGQSTLSNGGSGGTLTINGSVYQHADYEDGSIRTDGGNGGTDDPGTTVGSGANGGDIFIRGDAHKLSARTNGGDGSQHIGGNAGSITCYGLMTIQGDGLKANGGSCNSSNNDHHAGNGGNIAAYAGIHGAANIMAIGGTRSGVNTEAVTIFNYAPDAGSLDIQAGDLKVNTVILIGGNSATNYASGLGGLGGNITVQRGSIFIASSINIEGGDANGAAGGNGGFILCNGQIRCPQINNSGGSSLAAPGDNAVGDKGKPGNIDVLNGCYIEELIMNDGATGNDIGLGVQLTLAGTCTFGTLTMPNREDGSFINITPVSSSSTVFFSVKEMIGKLTVNYLGPPFETSALTNTPNSIFKFSNGAWYQFTGTAL